MIQVRKVLGQDEGVMMSLRKSQEQLKRVIHMEQLCDRITQVLASEENIAEQLQTLQDEIRELTEYYEGPLWLEDYDAEQNDAFPKDLSRGILTEDTLYDLLDEVERILGSVSDR